MHSVEAKNMTLPLIALKLLTIANISLERQAVFDSLARRTTWDSSYDFIVVGGGVAGSIVASRLSENPNWKVLLVEAGGSQSVLSEMPGMFHMVFFDNPNDWNYTTVPQTHANNKTFSIMRAKLLGGCSSVNAISHIRGNRHNYDYWAEHYGAKGWSYNDVLPYFMRFEKQTDPAMMTGEHMSHHGMNGPVTVRSPQITSTEREWFKQMQDSGYKLIEDINGPDYGPMTVGPVQQTIMNGRRLSTSSAYLEPNIGRTNLHILANSLVTKILFENATHPRTATGIQFYHSNTYHRVHATKEIIISGGAINSPQLLMLSGIGPAAHLETKGIHIVENLAGVGSNFHDGLGSYFHKRLEDDVWDDFKIYFENLMNVDHLYEFYNSGSGPLSMINLHTSAFNTKYNNNTEWPDAGFKPTTNLLSDGKQVFEHLDVGIQTLRPLSRGTIRLHSNSPFDRPLIDPQFYSNPTDLHVMIEAFRELHRVAAQSPLFSQLLEFDSNCQKCSDDILKCDSYFECLAKERSYPNIHLAGSCRMGSANDTNAVVDERLRVRGITNLRVIDASVMPQTTEPGTYAPTMMIGEKGAQLIKDDH